MQHIDKGVSYALVLTYEVLEKLSLVKNKATDVAMWICHTVSFNRFIGYLL